MTQKTPSLELCLWPLWAVVRDRWCILGKAICHVAKVKENALCVCFADVVVRLQALTQRHRPALHLRNLKQLDVSEDGRSE